MNLDRRSLLEGVCAAGVSVFITGFASAADGRARYVVRANSPSAADAVADAGFDVVNELADGGVLLAKGAEGAVDDLRNVGGVADAMRDVEVELERPVAEAGTEDAGLPDAPEDAYDELLWDKQMQDVREAHEHATGEGRTIAVIDTGVDDGHPDLDVNVDESAAVVGGELVDHTGDESYHGTHVAGIAAGTGDDLVRGVAPGAEIISVRVLYGGSGTFGDIMVGMEYAGQTEADAANISLGFMAHPSEVQVGAYRQMFEPVANRGARNGTLYVGSAGNDDTDLQDGWLRLWNGLAGVVGVSALTPDGERTFYSNHGTNDVDVGAPGGGYEDTIRTYCGFAEWIKAGRPLTPAKDPREPGTETHVCFDDEGGLIAETDEDAEDAAVCYPCTIPEWPYPFNLVFSSYPTDEGSYDWLAGTSMSAPQVTGLAALVRELEPEANTRQVEQAIEHGAAGSNGRSDPVLGAGRVNALETVEHLR